MLDISRDCQLYMEVILVTLLDIHPDKIVDALVRIFKIVNSYCVVIHHEKLSVLIRNYSIYSEFSLIYISTLQTLPILHPNSMNNSNRELLYNSFLFLFDMFCIIMTMSLTRLLYY